MVYIIFFISSFIIMNLFYYIFVINKEKALKNMKKGKELLLLAKIGKVDLNKVDLKESVKLVTLSNSFIIAVMGTLVMLLSDYIEDFYLWLIISSISAIIILIPFIMVVYRLIGKKLNNKKGKR